MIFRWVIKLIWVFHGYYMGLYSYLRYYNYLKCLSPDHLDHWSTGVSASIYFLLLSLLYIYIYIFLKSKRSRDPGDPPVILIENCHNNNWSTNDPGDPGKKMQPCQQTIQKYILSDTSYFVWYIIFCLIYHISSYVVAAILIAVL